mmetsp:Transcript_34949/g.57346  ORF Transcript_34949/g.57346 Transcript_34949/m.57346 type:complete len:113 (-) Transcript_34949:33-371(-)
MRALKSRSVVEHCDRPRQLPRSPPSHGPAGPHPQLLLRRAQPAPERGEPAAGGGGGAAEEGEEGHHGSRLRGDRALSHGVGLKAGVFQVDYAVTDTGVARLNLGLANPMFQY